MDKKERFERYKHSMGFTSWYVKPFKGKDLRGIYMNDGPNGVRRPTVETFSNQDNILVSVCMPNISALAASFDKDVCYKNGSLLADDCLSKGVDILLAPGVTLKRLALCGRNFEYFSEDPYLAGILGASYVKGLEDNGVGTCVKHFLCNNQEFFRHCVDSRVSLKALNEIYLRPFNYVIKYGNPTSIMSSYNYVNGEMPGESYYLMIKKCRQEYGFKGMFISDWCATNKKDLAIKNGMNLEMPISTRDYEYVDRLFKKHGFSEEDLIARDNEYFDSVKKFYSREFKNEYDFNLHHVEAIKVAQETLVLVKNKGSYLPLSTKNKVLVIGKFAGTPHFVGKGSGWVNSYKKESFIEFLTKNNIDFQYIEGYDEKEVKITKEELEKYKDKKYKVLLFLGLFDGEESEARDRKNLEISSQQIEVSNLVSEIFNKFATTIVTGSVVNIKEIYKKSSSVLISYLAGEGQAGAFYNNIFGLHNPSGRLPETWVSSCSQNKIYKEYFKYNPFYAYYDDDIYIGYRYYDLHKSGFMLPFGYGLSYTKFDYSNFKYIKNDKEIICNLDVTNIGKYDGSTVLLAFIDKPISSVYRAKKELKGFEKIFLKKGETKNLTIKINVDDLGVYNKESDKLEVEDGEYFVSLALDASTILNRSEGIYIKGNKLPEDLTPIKLKRIRKVKKFEYMTPIGCADNSPCFDKFFKEHGYSEEQIKHLHNMEWSALSDITYWYDDLTFTLLDELIKELNKDKKARNNIRNFLRGEDVQLKF